MQEITAYIKHRKLEAVTLALHRVQGVTGMSVAHAPGSLHPRTDRDR